MVQYQVESPKQAALKSFFFKLYFSHVILGKNPSLSLFHVRKMVTREFGCDCKPGGGAS